MNSMIKNYMATCVEDALDSILKCTGSCTCEKCRLDIAAIALNSLPPKYVVTKKGQMYIKLGNLQKQFDVDIIAAITKAIVIVNRQPRHEHDENYDNVKIQIEESILSSKPDEE